MSKTGLLPKGYDDQKLQSLTNMSNLLNAKIFEQIEFVKDEMRKSTTTIYHSVDLKEEFKLDYNAHLVSRKLKVYSQAEALEKNLELKTSFTNGKIKTMTYPSVDGKRLKLVYNYNKLGQLISLGTSENPQAFALFTYNPDNQVSNESQPLNGINRKFSYNSPGYLEEVDDKFMTQKVSYVEGGYGQEGYGDGIVMKTTFDAKWTKDVQQSFEYADKDENCIDFLKTSGFMDNNGKFKKIFKSNVETKTPLNCRNKSFDELSATNQLPSHYGHRYTYGTHRELVKAKYFDENSGTDIDPLQPNSFTKINGVSETMSQDIWKILKDQEFIAVDQRRDEWLSGIANQGGVSLLKDEELEAELKSLSLDSSLK